MKEERILDIGEKRKEYKITIVVKYYRKKEGEIVQRKTSRNSNSKGEKEFKKKDLVKEIKKKREITIVGVVQYHKKRKEKWYREK